MFRTKLSLIAILFLLSLLAYYAMAQEKTFVIEQAEPAAKAAPAAAANEASAPPPLQRIQGEMRAGALATDAYVVIKDHGASQTVMFYLVSKNGGMSLAHKARFLYNAPPPPKETVTKIENTTQVEGKIDLTILAKRSFICVKDHGFGQTAMSYTIDSNSKIKLLNRQAFLY